MHFKVGTSQLNKDGLVISVEGEFDLSTTEQVRRSAEGAISEGRPLLLDLSKCPFMDSTALRLVVQMHKRLSSGPESGAPMAVVASPAVHSFFSFTGVDLNVPVFLSQEQAVEYLRASGSHIKTSAPSPPSG
jgi:anti-anti-sigma factor